MTLAFIFAFIGGSLVGAAGLFCMAVIAAALQEHHYLQRELDRAAGAISSPALRSVAWPISVQPLGLPGIATAWHQFIEH